MEKHKQLKKTLSHYPINFTRSSYLESYAKKLKSMKSCSNNPKKLKNSTKSNMNKATPELNHKFIEKFNDISIIKKHTLDMSFISSIQDLKNLFPGAPTSSNPRIQSTKNEPRELQLSKSPQLFFRKYSKVKNSKQ
jgi:hypothetical protein